MQLENDEVEAMKEKRKKMDGSGNETSTQYSYENNERI